MGVLGAYDLWVHENFWKSIFRTCHGQLIYEEAENFRSMIGHSFENKSWTLDMLFGRFLEVTIVDTLYDELCFVDNGLCGLRTIFDCMENTIHLVSKMLHCCLADKKDLRVTELGDRVMLLPDILAIKGVSNSSGSG